MMRTRTIFALLLLVAGAANADSAFAGATKAPTTTVVRVAPTTHRPAGAELAEMVRAAVAASAVKLPKGATIKFVRPTAAVDVQLSRDRITIEMTPPARRAGSVITTAVLTFWKGGDIVSRLPISIELSVPAQALVFDVPKGASLSVVVRRGLVEVTAPAVLAADADLGDVVQVLLRPSGRSLRAQLVAKDRALAVEDAR
jgi:hypothetical protein